MSSAGATKDDFNNICGNVAKGYIISALLIGLQLHQHAGMNQGDWYKMHTTMTFTAGAAARVIAHSLGVAPTYVLLTPTTSTFTATKYWVSAMGQFNITITMDVDPGTNVTFNVELGAGSDF